MWNLPLAQVAQQQPGTREFIDSLARTPISKVLIFVAICTLVRLAIFPFMQNVPVHKRSGGFAFLKILNESMDAIVYAGVFVFMLIRPYAVQAFIIPSGSMIDTLMINDFILANKAVYRYSDPKRGDIVVFRPPVEAILENNQLDEKGEVKVDFIKRLIGVPGDLIEIKDTVLYRNGVAIKEPYADYTTGPNEANLVDLKELNFDNDFKLVERDGQPWPVNFINGFPAVSSKKYRLSDMEFDELAKKSAIRIPKGYYFMVGDNRNGSFDGRFWGLVPRDSIIGRAEVIWLPMSRWQRLH